jgi:phosphopantetheine adenylyltransferase
VPRRTAATRQSRRIIHVKIIPIISKCGEIIAKYDALIAAKIRSGVSEKINSERTQKRNPNIAIKP